MDKMISFLSGHLAGKVLDYVVSQFHARVIERWSRRRAETFFEEFCREVELELLGRESDRLDALLDHMLNDDLCSGVLFDAYRRVCLSRSKEMGPRIIAILTAQLVCQDRMADDVEDNMLWAAENLADNQLLEFAHFVREHKARAEGKTRGDASFDDQGNLRVEWYKEQFDSNWRGRTSVSVGPLDLAACLGKWAAELKARGIVTDDVKERQWDYREDSERHIDEPGTIRELSWWICVPKAYFRLAEIIERAAKRAPGACPREAT